MEGKVPEQKKEKGLIGKLKDAAEDKEHQIEVLGTFVRLGVVVWSGFIITMNYIDTVSYTHLRAHETDS